MSRVITMPGPLEGVQFANVGLQPPSNVYVGREDAIFITTYASTTALRVDVRCRFMRADGVIIPIQTQIVPASNRTAVTVIEPIGEGWLLNLSVFLGSGTAKRGQCYAVVGIARGLQTSRFDHTILAQGYVGTAINLAWPGSQLEQPAAGPGCVRSITGTNPAAGQTFSETVPTGARWRVLSFYVRLTTDATVANRLTSLVYDDGSAILAAAPCPPAQTASQILDYSWAVGMTTLLAASGGAISIALPSAMILPAGYRVRGSSSGIQAADDWGAPQYEVEEWIDP